ncbi:hypothetical protein LX73_0941 [Fodinibius salinus]|uniref:Methyltransferase domain-containing protein n=1 Tax=Fodinibius salinus TaxID=860790 RepID=A0A5D3YNB3_9BACT|nr:hypothetical protein [Fodinibius salinus]TYP95626.1 hypothetical protein LX73_0941 [Fodinibius salinus]
MNIYVIHLAEGFLAFLSNLGLHRNRLESLYGEQDVDGQYYHQRIVRGINHFDNFYHDLSEKENFLEFGTGSACIDLVIAYLLGFEKIITCDINDHISLNYLKSINLFEEHLDKLSQNFSIKKKVLLKRFDKIRDINNKNTFFDRLNITFLKFNELEDFNIDKIDVWYSISNLQRIPLENLLQYSKIATKALKRNGIAYHKVDCNDIHSQPHYPFSSNKIHRLDYLKYQDSVWKLLNNKKYGCQNRIRYPQYMTLFEGLSMSPSNLQLYVDQEDIDYVEKRMSLPASFKYMTPKQIAVTHFKVILKKEPKGTMNKTYFRTSELDNM